MSSLQSNKIHFGFIDAANSASQLFSLIGFFRMVASPNRHAGLRTTQAQIRHVTCSPFSFCPVSPGGRISLFPLKAED